MAKQKVAIVQKDAVAESAEVIADAVIKVSDGFAALAKSRLTQRAIVLLLHDAIGASNIAKRDIVNVLNEAPRLKDYYIKKAPVQP